MLPRRGRQRVEFPPSPGRLWWAIPLCLSGGFALLCSLNSVGRKERDVYVPPNPRSAWVSDFSVQCDGGDTFEVGHIETPDDRRPNRMATPYFLVWNQPHGWRRYYPLCVGGYTLQEAGWAVEMRAWWGPHGGVKRAWVVARSAAPGRSSFVLGALNNIDGLYWSAYGWRNQPKRFWQWRTSEESCRANPLPAPCSHDEVPSWATRTGGQVLAATELPRTWNALAVEAKGVPRQPAGGSAVPGLTDWDAVMSGELGPPVPGPM